MKPQLLLAAMLVTISAWSKPQTDTIPGAELYCVFPKSVKPVFRLTDKDLARLPFTNIMEAVNGRFPFVFGDPPSTITYTFLVDGLVLLNPNSINISQIALIEFYPVSLDAGSGSLSSRGTFVITTKKGAESNGFHIRSQTGIILPTDKSFGPTGTSDYDLQKELFTYQELGYMLNGQRFQFSGAVSYTRNANQPGYKMQQGGVSEEFHHEFNRGRVSLFGGYNITDKLRLSATFLGTLQGNNVGSKYTQLSGTTFDGRASDKVSYWGAQLGLEFKPTASISNSFNVIYTPSRIVLDRHTLAIQPPGNPTQEQVDHNVAKLTRLAILNTTKGIINRQQPVELGWELTLRYHESDLDANMRSVIGPIGQPPVAFSTGEAHYDEDGFAIMPAICINADQRLFARAGLAYDTWDRTGYQKQEDKDKVFPFGGIQYIVPVKSNALSLLEFHSTYGKSMQFNFRNDQLDAYSWASSTTPAVGTYSSFGETRPGYTWITGVNTGFVNDRLVLSLNYLRGNAFPALLIRSPIGYVINYVEVARDGISGDLQAVIVNKEKFSCKLRTVLFYERIELKENSSGGTITPDDNPLLNEHHSPQWRGSASLDLAVGKVFMHALALLNFKDRGYSGVPAPKIISNHGLTFVTLGYSFQSGSAKRARQWDVSIQARNLLLMKEPRATIYYGSRYVGVGVNARL
ncbi:MAG TPA: hypothetical protein VD993_01100 [Chitinophagaceae bacterium]|nr:hypothetical protein [Chitinophagaceae bacterium]